VKFPKKVKLFSGVELTWLDSCSSRGWQRYSEWKKDEFESNKQNLLHTTLGYLVLETDLAVSIAPSCSLNRVINHLVVLDIIDIPKAAIVSFKVVSPPILIP